MPKMNIIITGVTSGIGKELCKAYVNAGHCVFGIGRRKENLNSLREELKESTGNFIPYEFDLSELQKLPELTQKIQSEFNFINLFIANAGYSIKDNTLNLGLNEIHHNLKVNFLATLGILDAIKESLSQNKGQVALISSFLADVNLPGFTSYTISKKAIDLYHSSSYLEYKSIGIDLTLIHPGFTKSDIRNRDKSGHYHSSQQSANVSFLEMETSLVAAKIINAIKKRKRKSIIGLHTKVLIFVFRYFGFVLYPLINFMYKNHLKKSLLKAD